jgi:hypothetical protein
MGRNIGVAVLGYVVMFVGVFLLMTIAWMILGADGAFEPGTWDISFVWIVASIFVGLFAAIPGGMLAEKLGDGRALKILIGIVVVLGVASAIPDPGSAPAIRPDGISMWDAVSSAVQPRWLALLNPVIGVVGIMIGASKAKAG